MIGMMAIYPLVERFEFDEDEGIELMKGRLLADGHSLYAEVWDDQPPVLSAAFAGIYRLAGASVTASRFLVLAISALLLLSWQAVSMRLGGRGLALATLGIVITQPFYLKLSLSAMAGLPAVALASAALACQIRWHQDRSRLALAASGGLIALAILTKLFLVILLPVLFVGIVLADLRNRRRQMRNLSLWLVTGAGVGGLIAVAWLAPEAWEQLVAPHASARQVEAYQDEPWLRGFDASWALISLAAAGAVQRLRRRQWLWLYPTVWTVIALVMLLGHRPVWYHQRLLVLVPAAILAASALVEALRWIRPGAPLRRLATSLLVIAAVGVMAGQHLPPLRAFVMRGDSATEARRLQDRIVVDLREQAAPGSWVVTDRPIYAFRADLAVPPPVAVITAKRRVTGRLDEDVVLAAIDDYRIDVVLLARFDWSELPERPVDGWQPTRYGERSVLYVRKETGQ